MINKYDELLEALEVGKIYRYIGDGEFEIIDINEEVQAEAKRAVAEALKKSIFGGSKLP